MDRHGYVNVHGPPLANAVYSVSGLVLFRQVREPTQVDGVIGLSNVYPEGNGVAEWFIRTLKEQVICPNMFKNMVEATDAIEAFVQEFKKSWTINT